MEGTSVTLDSIGTFTIPSITMLGTSVGIIASSGTFVIPAITFYGNIDISSSGIFEIPAIVFGDYGPALSGGLFTIPSIEFHGDSFITQVTRQYKGIIMNLLNQAISTYSNFGFNSLVCYKGVYYGAKDDGIYPLNNSSDNGVRINASLKTGPMNFGDTFIKHLRDIWLTHRTDGHLRILIYVDEDTSVIAQKDTILSGDRMREERIKPPRGLKGRYYVIELKNLSGADFDLDTLSLLVESIQRKSR